MALIRIEFDLSLILNKLDDQRVVPLPRSWKGPCGLNRTEPLRREINEELVKLAKEMREASRRGEKLSLNDDEVAFYDALGTNDSAVKILGDETLKAIAQELVATIRRNVTIDWTVRETVQKFGYPPDKQEKATQTVNGAG